ncbi:cytochrome b/b6 domain-containing protein [Zavarzinia aquatilis]|uniref:Cytochrome B n=1 Tax=Zavarzinia aquatilis TaxID=2211142 RepID=A0A317ECK5_9PROT|nr:cytochrome b/b6 domain-containing protein [Zavarzinia aquatilis]PWR24451.1 cytochrome B [Zavarzinia aquatilis]
MSSDRLGTVSVWDPLVRLFHWSLVASIAIAWFSEEGEALHRWSGYVALGLIAFRLVWGVVGPRYARFTDFVRSPFAALAYLIDEIRGRGRRYLGHNPAGGVMVVVLLVMIAVTGISGWLSTTDRFFGDDLVSEIHEVSANLLLASVGLHVLGVIFSSLMHRENLVRAMITGRKAP